MSGLSLFNKPSCRFSCSSYLQFHMIVLLSRSFFALLISCVIFLLTSLYFAAPSGSHFLLFNSLLLSQRSRMSAVTHGFFWYFVEGVGQQVHVGIFVIHYDKGCKFPTYHCFECFCFIRFFTFLGVKLVFFCWLWFADPLQANVAVCHQQLMITSDICSLKASCPDNVHSSVKAPFHKDVVEMIVMFSILAVPGPSSRCFVWAKCVSQHQLIVHCKFEEPVTSLICFHVAEMFASVLPVGLRILSHFCILVS